MQKTKHDLCADSVRLDWDALEMTTKIAVRRCLDNIHDYSRKISDSNSDNVEIYIYAEYLSREACALQIAAETLYTISAGRDREEILTINKKKEEK